MARSAETGGRHRRGGVAVAALSTALLLGGGMLGGGGAAAHVDGQAPLQARLHSVGPPGPATLVFELGNATAGAITLTALRAPGGRLRLERRWRLFFGLIDAWQPVRFVRVEPGDRVRLGPPDYRISGAPGAFAALEKPGGGVAAEISPYGPVIVLYDRSESVFSGDAPSPEPDRATARRTDQTTE